MPDVGRVLFLGPAFLFLCAPLIAAQQEDEYRLRRDTQRRAIHRAVDQFVERESGRRGATAIAGGLSRLLNGQTPDADYSDPPSARLVTTGGGTALLVTYTLFGRRHDSSPSIRAYLPSSDGRYRLIAAAGDDFADGWTVRSRVVSSPRAGHFWLMAWGKREGLTAL
jgi:hypothetical protein